jgi:hypothetical protein
MSRSSVIGERPSGSRIDDLGSTHISVSPETGLFWPATTRAPSAAGLAATPPGSALLHTRAPMR